MGGVLKVGRGWGWELGDRELGASCHGEGLLVAPREGLLLWPLSWEQPSQMSTSSLVSVRIGPHMGQESTVGSGLIRSLLILRPEQFQGDWLNWVRTASLMLLHMLISLSNEKQNQYLVIIELNILNILVFIFMVSFKSVFTLMVLALASGFLSLGNISFENKGVGFKQ